MSAGSMAVRGIWVAVVALGVAGLTAGAAGAAGPGFVATSGAAQATIVDLASRAQAEAVLSFAATLLRRTPAHLSDMDAYWGDGTLQIDCLNHLTRWRVTTGYNLDRTRRFDAPNPAFGAWSDDPEGSVGRALESYVCHGVRSPDVTEIADLTGFARAYLGGQVLAQGNGAQAGRAAAAPAPSPPPEAAQEGLAHFYMTTRNADYAELIDMSVRRRKGKVASAALYQLHRTPFHTQDGDDYRWNRYDFEVDCAGHRDRRAFRAYLSFETHTRAINPHPPQFLPWEPIYPSAIEALVCDERVEPGLMAVADLEAFQRWFDANAAGQ